jgi:hypothetical protein
MIFLDTSLSYLTRVVGVSDTAIRLIIDVSILHSRIYMIGEVKMYLKYFSFFKININGNVRKLIFFIV